MPRLEWHDGKIYKYPCPADRKMGLFFKGFMYGISIFEGIRAYWNPELENLFVFRIRDHFERMINNAIGIMKFDVPYTADELTEATLKLLRKEKYRTNVYIRPLIFLNDMGVGVDGNSVSVIIVAVPFEKYNLKNKDSLSVCLTTWRRADNSMLPPRGKIGGLYAQSHLAKKEARLAGYDDAIFLNANGTISEGSAANIMWVKNGKLYTPDTDSNILEGITRKTIFELATNELGLETLEGEWSSGWIYSADELFFCGTGAEIEPISSINKTHAVGNGSVGPITLKIQKVYFDIVYGRDRSHSEWLTPVYPVRNLR
ncbi:MAG: hypothetical protein UU22_C0021G0002 [Parcubacteria group bacterium GW2011_GWA2_40_8]|nr:MAG: hypothetical protein UU22_C0021G0002 [Parcubacteria group bacterium GW2011_GWA2_40_8]